MATLDIKAVGAHTQRNDDALLKLASGHATPDLIQMAIASGGNAARMKYVGNPKDISKVSDSPLTILEIWENPYFPSDPAHMIGLYSEIKPNAEGKAEKHPQEWLIGPEARFFVIYKMSCCEGYSALFSTKDSEGNRQSFTSDDERYTHKGQKRYFEGKILLDTPDDGSAYKPEQSRLYHIYMHRTGIEHSCDNHNNYKSATGAAPAPKMK